MIEGYGRYQHQHHMRTVVEWYIVFYCANQDTNLLHSTNPIQINSSTDVSNFDQYSEDDTEPSEDLTGWDKEFWFIQSVFMCMQSNCVHTFHQSFLSRLVAPVRCLSTLWCVYILSRLLRVRLFCDCVSVWLVSLCKRIRFHKIVFSAYSPLLLRSVCETLHNNKLIELSIAMVGKLCITAVIVSIVLFGRDTRSISWKARFVKNSRHLIQMCTYSAQVFIKTYSSMRTILR